ncbi:MAG TPA: ABC transporter permease [Acidimicrobiales bacterium]|nr:ABC transporter permease [Acidimicrobiales bacterium]
MGLVGANNPLVDWGWVSSNQGKIASLLWQHVQLTAIAVAIGLAISLPVGVLAWRAQWLRPVAVGISGTLYVIPSVAVLALAAPLTGFFSITTAEVALVSYTLLVLVRNVIAGLDSVPPDAHQVARGMGYTTLQELFKVQLPLALPSIFAGLRVATVTTVGLVNVTAFIGQGGLGQLIITGFTEDFNTPIVVGLALSVLLAAVADAAIVLLQTACLPWARGRGAVVR